MGHNHTPDIIVDPDPHFTIDTTTRAITNATYKKLSLMQYDHNSERFSFDIDLEVEGHNVLDCNRIQIHYINVDSSTRSKHIGLYEVSDLKVHPDDNKKAYFTWLISEQATRYTGSLSFLISFACAKDDGEILYRWNSGICNMITIAQGINNNDTVVEQYTDELLKWENYIVEHLDELEEELKNTIVPELVDERYIEREFATSEEVAGVFALSADDVDISSGIVQTTGDSATKVMSQKAVTEAIGDSLKHEYLAPLQCPDDDKYVIIDSEEGTITFPEDTLIYDHLYLGEAGAWHWLGDEDNNRSIRYAYYTSSTSVKIYFDPSVDRLIATDYSGYQNHNGTGITDNPDLTDCILVAVIGVDQRWAAVNLPFKFDGLVGGETYETDIDCLRQEIGSTAFVATFDIKEAGTKIALANYDGCMDTVKIDWGDGTIDKFDDTATDSEALIATFCIARADTEITLQNLTGMTSIDWGDGTVGSNLSHTYTTIGEYECKIYGVTEIGRYAFYQCECLVSVEIPSSITSIGYGAFDTCTSLMSIKIPDSVTSIGKYAFKSNYCLKNVTIPKSVTSIGYCAFSSCFKLSTITFKSGVVITYDNWFDNSYKITSIYVPHTCDGIYKQTWVDLADKIYVAEMVRHTYANAGKFKCVFYGLTTVGFYMFSGLDSLVNIEISDSVTSIGQTAFYDCSNLTEVKIPKSVVSIGGGAFYGCNSLIEVTIDSPTLTSFANSFDPSVIQKIYVPHDSLEAYKEGWAGQEIADKITAIAEMGDIDECRNYPYVVKYKAVVATFNITEANTEILRPGTGTVTSVDWGDGTVDSNRTHTYTATGKYEVIVYGDITRVQISTPCYELTSIKIPDSVTVLGNSEFMGSVNLTSIVIGNGVTQIGQEAFMGCKSFTSIVIPESVASIGDYVFENCDALTTVTFNNPTPITYASHWFEGCSNLSKIYVPHDSVAAYKEAWAEIADKITSIAEITDLSGFVRFDKEQSIAEAQQIQARRNINAAKVVDVYTIVIEKDDNGDFVVNKGRTEYISSQSSGDEDGEEESIDGFSAAKLAYASVPQIQFQLQDVSVSPSQYSYSTVCKKWQTGTKRYLQIVFDDGSGASKTVTIYHDAATTDDWDAEITESDECVKKTDLTDYVKKSGHTAQTVMATATDGTYKDLPFAVEGKGGTIAYRDSNGALGVVDVGTDAGDRAVNVNSLKSMFPTLINTTDSRAVLNSALNTVKQANSPWEVQCRGRGYFSFVTGSITRSGEYYMTKETRWDYNANRHTRYMFDINVASSETMSATKKTILTTSFYKWMTQAFPVLEVIQSTLSTDPSMEAAKLKEEIIKTARYMEIAEYAWRWNPAVGETTDTNMLNGNGAVSASPSYNRYQNDGDDTVYTSFHVLGTAIELDSYNTKDLTIDGMHMKVYLYE